LPARFLLSAVLLTVWDFLPPPRFCPSVETSSVSLLSPFLPHPPGFGHPIVWGVPLTSATNRLAPRDTLLRPVSSYATHWLLGRSLSCALVVRKLSHSLTSVPRSQPVPFFHPSFFWFLRLLLSFSCATVISGSPCLFPHFYGTLTSNRPSYFGPWSDPPHLGGLALSLSPLGSFPFLISSLSPNTQDVILRLPLLRVFPDGVPFQWRVAPGLLEHPSRVGLHRSADLPTPFAFMGGTSPTSGIGTRPGSTRTTGVGLLSFFNRKTPFS